MTGAHVMRKRRLVPAAGESHIASQFRHAGPVTRMATALPKAGAAAAAMNQQNRSHTVSRRVMIALTIYAVAYAARYVMTPNQYFPVHILIPFIHFLLDSVADPADSTSAVEVHLEATLWTMVSYACFDSESAEFVSAAFVLAGTLSWCQIRPSIIAALCVAQLVYSFKLPNEEGGDLVADATPTNEEERTVVVQVMTQHCIGFSVSMITRSQPIFQHVHSTLEWIWDRINHAVADAARRHPAVNTLVNGIKKYIVTPAKFVGGVLLTRWMMGIAVWVIMMHVEWYFKLSFGGLLLGSSLLLGVGAALVDDRKPQQRERGLRLQLLFMAVTVLADGIVYLIAPYRLLPFIANAMLSAFVILFFIGPSLPSIDGDVPEPPLETSNTVLMLCLWFAAMIADLYMQRSFGWQPPTPLRALVAVNTIGYGMLTLVSTFVDAMNRELQPARDALAQVTQVEVAMATRNDPESRRPFDLRGAGDSGDTLDDSPVCDGSDGDGSDAYPADGPLSETATPESSRAASRQASQTAALSSQNGSFQSDVGGGSTSRTPTSLDAQSNSQQQANAAAKAAKRREKELEKERNEERRRQEAAAQQRERELREIEKATRLENERKERERKADQERREREERKRQEEAVAKAAREKKAEPEKARKVDPTPAATVKPKPGAEPVPPKEKGGAATTATKPEKEKVAAVTTKPVAASKEKRDSNGSIESPTVAKTPTGPAADKPAPTTKAAASSKEDKKTSSKGDSKGDSGASSPTAANEPSSKSKKLSPTNEAAPAPPAAAAQKAPAVVNGVEIPKPKSKAGKMAASPTGVQPPKPTGGSGWSEIPAAVRSSNGAKASASGSPGSSASVPPSPHANASTPQPQERPARGAVGMPQPIGANSPEPESLEFAATSVNPPGKRSAPVPNTLLAVGESPQRDDGPHGLLGDQFGESFHRAMQAMPPTAPQPTGAASNNNVDDSSFDALLQNLQLQSAADRTSPSSPDRRGNNGRQLPSTGNAGREPQAANADGGIDVQFLQMALTNGNDGGTTTPPLMSTPPAEATTSPAASLLADLQLSLAGNQGAGVTAGVTEKETPRGTDVWTKAIDDIVDGEDKPAAQSVQGMQQQQQAGMQLYMAPNGQAYYVPQQQMQGVAAFPQYTQAAVAAPQPGVQYVVVQPQQQQYYVMPQAQQAMFTQQQQPVQAQAQSPTTTSPQHQRAPSRSEDDSQ